MKLGGFGELSPAVSRSNRPRFRRKRHKGVKRHKETGQQQQQQQHSRQWLAHREGNGLSDTFLTHVIPGPLDSAPELVLPVTGHLHSAMSHQSSPVLREVWSGGRRGEGQGSTRLK